MSDAVVVVGAGLAGAKVVETLLKEGFDGRLTLIGAEPYPPYVRTGLSKEVLRGVAEAESLIVHPLQWYQDAGVATHLGDAATALDLAARRVRLASGLEVPYDQLVITTGSHARKVDLPGADLEGVLSLRTMDDGLTLRANLVPGRRLVLVGGGWIGLEAAAAASLAGCSVTVLEAGRLPLLNVLGETIAEHFARLHTAHGVVIRTEVKVAGFEGADGHVTGVRVGDEVLPADVVLVGVGAIPNTALAEAAGLAVDNGILVDEHLRTADPAVLAAGDVANAYNTLLGRRLRVEHWDNARRQGRLAALSVLGQPKVYDWQPYFYTDQYDLSMEYVGNAGRDADIVLRGRTEDGSFIAFWLESGLITAAMNVNIDKVNPTLRKLVGRQIGPERLADPGIALEDLVSQP